MTEIINFLIEYHSLIILGIVIIAIAALAIRSFIEFPTTQKLQKIQEWMLYAVTEAEKELGSGTGQIKLRLVYDMFINKFPSLSKHISFNTFSVMVDDALERFRAMLTTNKHLQEYIYGGNQNDETASN